MIHFAVQQKKKNNTAVKSNYTPKTKQRVRFWDVETRFSVKPYEFYSMH